MPLERNDAELSNSREFLATASVQNVGILRLRKCFTSLRTCCAHDDIDYRLPEDAASVRLAGRTNASAALYLRPRRRIRLVKARPWQAANVGSG